jgi:arylsulfatase A-like enzyme
MKYVFFLILLFIQSMNLSAQEKFATEHVIVVVMDGARYQETYGDSSYQYIPNLNRLKSQGVLFTNFSNNGKTLTNSGHGAIVTGNYQALKNNGNQLPANPTMFQYFQKEKGVDKTDTWIVSSKGKLEILANTTDKKWWNRYNPMTYCGVKGQSVVYEGDAKNFEKVKEVIRQDTPQLMLVNFLEADAQGHQNNWKGYVNGIRNIDKLISELWNYIQADPDMKNTTTLFVTNDHGRHNDGVKQGFKEHGDNCSGCKHIFLLAIGPDFKQNISVSKPAELIDIPTTIAYLLNFQMPTSKGRILKELFK